MEILRCRYEDCANGYPIAAEDEAVTCNLCREYLGLPPIGLKELRAMFAAQDKKGN